jgi:hypothetical protein
MIFCLGITARNLIERFLPDQDISYLPYFCFVVSLAGIYSQRKLHKSSELEINPLIYRAVEWVVILVILKLTIYAANGFDRLFIDLPRWQTNFIESFFEAEYLLSILVVLIVWALTLMFTEDLVDLEGDVNILQATTLDMVVSNRSLTQNRLAARVLTLGIVLTILATLTRLDFATMFQGIKLAEFNTLHILVYFLLGLVLLSLTQLATRRAVWAWEHIPVSEKIARNWVVYSLGFLFILLLIAFALPTSYTLGFMPTIRYFLNLLFGLLYTLVLLIIIPIFLLFSWLISLFGGTRMLKPPMSLPEQVFPPLPEDLASTPSPILAILKSVLFWGILIFVIGYAFTIYLRQNKELMQKLRRLPGLSWLVKAWRWLILRTRAGVNFIPMAIDGGLKRLRSIWHRDDAQSQGNYVSIRRLDSRQKILFYYLALIRRGSEAGMPRKPYQTPNDYEVGLIQKLPGSETDLDAMTQAFVEARYSRHPVNQDTVGLVRHAWEHVRAILNQKRSR